MGSRYGYMPRFFILFCARDNLPTQSSPGNSKVQKGVLKAIL